MNPMSLHWARNVARRADTGNACRSLVGKVLQNVHIKMNLRESACEDWGVIISKDGLWYQKHCQCTPYRHSIKMGLYILHFPRESIRFAQECGIAYN
jgi:hypothetical protein